MKRLCFLIALVASMGRAGAQLHLITASPTPKSNENFPAALWRVSDDGLQSVAELSPRRGGTYWIGISHDLKKALVLGVSDAPIVVVDFDKGAVVKQCNDHGAGSLIEQFLSDVRGKGLLFIEYVAYGTAVRDSRLRAMSLDPAAPCGFAPVDVSEVKYAVADGHAGPANSGSYDGLVVQIDNGSLVRRFANGTSYLGYQLPEAAFDKADGSSRAIFLINNSQIAAVSVGPSASYASERLFVFRKRDTTWRRVAVPGTRVFWARGFGNWIAVCEASTKRYSSEESAGRAEWKRADLLSGSSLEEQFREPGMPVFAGRLHLYNAETERMRTIVTNQGDSEIILVDGETVYYRVSDRLYAAAITEQGFGPAKLL